MGKNDQPRHRQPPPGQALLISPERAAKLMALLDRLDLEPDPVQFQRYTRAGKLFFRLRDQAATGPGGGGGGGAPLYATLGIVEGSDPVEYQFTVSPGVLEYQNAGAADFELGPLGYIVPTMGGVSLEDAENLQPLPLPGLVSFLYLRVKTDADGVPKTADGGGHQVTIEVFPERQTSTHHVRQSPSSGEEDGDYFILLAQTESDGGSPAAPRIVRRITGNRTMPNQLVKNKNIGGERELYKGYLVGPDDEHEWRTLKQIEGGEDQEVGVIKALEDGEDEEDFIEFKGFGVKQTGQYPPRPAAFEEDEAGDVNLLNFTGIDGDVEIPAAGGTFTFAGGLAVSFGGNADEEGEGRNLNLTVITFEWAAAGPEGSMMRLSEYTDRVHYFRDGRYVGTTDPGDAPAGLVEQTVTHMVESS